MSLHRLSDFSILKDLKPVVSPKIHALSTCPAVPQVEHVSQSPGTPQGSVLGASVFVGLGWGLRRHIPNKFLSDADAVGLGSTL